MHFLLAANRSYCSSIWPTSIEIQSLVCEPWGFSIFDVCAGELIVQYEIEFKLKNLVFFFLFVFLLCECNSRLT